MITLRLIKFAYFSKVKQSVSSDNETQPLASSSRCHTVSVTLLVSRMITVSGERKIKSTTEDRREGKKKKIYIYLNQSRDEYPKEKEGSIERREFM